MNVSKIAFTALDSQDAFVLDEELIEEIILPCWIGCTDCAERTMCSVNMKCTQFAAKFYHVKTEEKNPHGLFNCNNNNYQTILFIYFCLCCYTMLKAKGQPICFLLVLLSLLL